MLDAAPVLDEPLIRLGQWIADYYLAPIGEVFRTMLPLGAEFKKAIAYSITEQGHMALHLAGMTGSSARSQKPPEDQLAEFRVLDYLAEREMTREESLRAATRASKRRPVRLDSQYLRMSKARSTPISKLSSTLWPLPAAGRPSMHCSL